MRYGIALPTHGARPAPENLGRLASPAEDRGTDIPVAQLERVAAAVMRD
jgi:hypothetical protein